VFACSRGRLFFFFLIAGREVVFADASIQRAGYVIRYIYQKVASDLQRRSDKGLVGLAEGLQRRREAGPLRPDGTISRPPEALGLHGRRQRYQNPPPPSSTSRHCECHNR